MNFLKENATWIGSVLYALGFLILIIPNSVRIYKYKIKGADFSKTSKKVKISIAIVALLFIAQAILQTSASTFSNPFALFMWLLPIAFFILFAVDMRFPYQTKNDKAIQKLRRFRYLGGGLAVAGAAFIAFGLTSGGSTPVNNSNNNQASSSQIASWKTYRSDQHGFEFKYPSSWTVYPYALDGVIDFISANQSDGSEAGIAVKSIGKMSLDDAKLFVEKKRKELQRTQYGPPEFVTIQEAPAVRYSYTPFEIIPPGLIYYFYEKGIEFEISDLFEDGQIMSASTGTTQQIILSSIKFF
ncbi:MAG: hypothetical protein G01um101420_837 [Parcubacteria group bacterium Gr01-1014_20]|nr:MAG: hypothetical protein G01um101420_837 [Parcubacteria group bacterium Gr01-1014_20]